MLLAALLVTTALTGTTPPLNAVIGDAGFIARFGRAPTDRDAGATRIRAHLDYVIARLRAASPAVADPIARARRDALLDALAEYAAAGAFPHNHSVAGRRPVFIDEDGNVCAVGYLVEVSAGRDEAERIAADHRWDYIADIDDEALDRWAVDNGFTAVELAMIQPSYDWERPIIGPPEPPIRLPIDPPIVPVVTGPILPAGYPSIGFMLNGTIAQTRANGGTWTDRNGFTTHLFQSGPTEFLLRLDPQGNMVGSGRISGDTLSWRAWYDTGKLAAIGTYVNDMPHGAWTLFDGGGARIGTPRFVEGECVSRCQLVAKYRLPKPRIVPENGRREILPD